MASPRDTPQAPVRPGQIEPSRATIMVVDDDPAQAQHTASLVSELGYRVRLATDWIEAVRMFDDAVVDLVLMDAVMPTVDGFKLTRMLRARMRSFVPIVFLTSLREPNARAQGLVAGADDFLHKPVRPEALSLRIAAMLRIRQLTRVLESKSRELELMANQDALTGVGNRRAFEACLEREWERARRYAHPLSLVLIDLDHFKEVNDRFGHEVGDALLAFVGEVLEMEISGGERAFRYGGEEFVVLAPEQGPERARNLAERLRRAVAGRSGAASAAGPRTCSAGVAGIPAPGLSSPGALFEAADRALYAAKERGRDQVVCWVPELAGEPLPRTG